LNAVVVHLETKSRGVGDGQLIQIVIFEIDEVVAPEADQVVVELEAGIEAGDPARVAGLGDHTHAGEVFEGAVDGGARDARETRFDGIENLIGRRMVVEVEDRLEDDPPLHSAAFAALAAQPPEELDAVSTCRLVQAAAPSLAIVDDGAR
jgi:hypothetical protein